MEIFSDVAVRQGVWRNQEEAEVVLVVVGMNDAVIIVNVGNLVPINLLK